MNVRVGIASPECDGWNKKKNYCIRFVSFLVVSVCIFKYFVIRIGKIWIIDIKEKLNQMKNPKETKEKSFTIIFTLDDDV